MKKWYVRRFVWVSVIVVLCTVAYFFSRLTNLANLPIFTDEAIYIRWAQIAKQDASWRFIALTDGKQPLFVWTAMVTLRFIADPLIAGRMVSVIAGFGSLIGMFFLGRELFKSDRIGLFSSLVYLLSPFSLMYDRMALMDSMVAMFVIWSLFLEIKLVRNPRMDLALLLGMSIGAAVLTKTSGFFCIYLMPSTLLLFDWKKHQRSHRLSTWLLYALIAAGMSQVYYSVLRLSPWFHMIAQKDTTFIYSFSEWLEHPFRFLQGNLHGLFDWLYGYLTFPITLLIVGSLLMIYKNWKEKMLLFCWFLPPLVALALFGKVLYPRFILFMTMPLLILAAWFLAKVTWYVERRFAKTANKALMSLAVLIAVGAYPAYVDAKIVYSIVTAPIPNSDLGQYVNDVYAGWGIREAVDILATEAETKKIAVYTEGTFGLLPYGIEIYLVDNPNIEIIGIWPIPVQPGVEMQKKIREKPTFYISNATQELKEGWSADLVASYQKGNNQKRLLRLYRLTGIKQLLFR